MACSSLSTSQKKHPHKHTPISKSYTLDQFQTSRILKLWKANKFQQLPKIKNHSVTFINKHKLASSIHSIKSGYDVSTFSTRNIGIGLPVVVQTNKYPFTAVSDHAYYTNTHPATLVANKVTTKSGNHITLTLHDPRDQNASNPQNFSTQKNIVIDNLLGNSSLKILGLIKPHKYKNLQGFYLSRPYDKNRIPIIIIHGLLATPETLMDMAETIEAQPDLNKKYQIWHYYYPTGIPWLVTAHDFRSSFRNLVKTVDPTDSHANLDKSIIIAHSMGGLITRLSVSDPKQSLAENYLGKVDLHKTFNKNQAQKLSQYFHYKPLTEPRKVIFLAVPHQGTRLTNGFLAWAANKIIAIPTKILKGKAKVLKTTADPTNKHIAATLKLITESNSIDQLQPKNPAIKALNQMPLPKSIEFHSIIGDIGPFRTRIYSDGIISYYSSHLKNVSSETIVKFKHDIYSSPDTIQQIIKILRSTN